MSVRIRVRNYQSIRDASIVADGLTVITGPNNSGKTAMLRAIRGVVQNTPGSAFVRHDTKECTVNLEFDDGHTVEWTKGKDTKPTYRVDGGNPIHPGRAVPDEVKALGIVPIKAGDQEIWPTIAPQFSGQMFLIDKPGSVLAEAVADVERVGHLNRALRVVESDLRAANSELRVRQSDLEKQSVALAHFEGLDQVADLVDRSEKAAIQVGRVETALLRLRGTRDRLLKARGVAQRFAGLHEIIVPQLGTLGNDLRQLEQLRGVQRRFQHAQTTATRFQGVDQITVPSPDTTRAILREMLDLGKLRIRLRKAQAECERFGGFAGLDPSISVQGPERILQALDRVRGLKKKMEQAQSTVQEHTNLLRTAERDVEVAGQEVQAELEKSKNCPTCGHPL